MKAQDVTRSMEFSLRIWEESYAMLSAAQDQLSEALDRAGIKVGPPTWHHRMDENGWIITDYGFSLPLRKVNRGEPRSYLSVQVSLHGSGIALAGNCEPLIHVGLWEDPLGEDCLLEYWADFPNNDDYGDDWVRVIDGCIISYVYNKFTGTTGEWHEQSWTFSLPLFEIGTPDDIVKMLVNPLKKLIKGEGLEEAFKKLPIIRYEQDENGQVRRQTGHGDD